MRKLLATTPIAVAVLMTAGIAHASPLIDNSTSATAIAAQGQIQGQGQSQGQRQNMRQGQGQGQGQGQSQSNNFNDKKQHNNAPGLALGSAVAHGGFYNGAVRNACSGSRGQGWMAGLTGGADNGVVTGGGLGVGRSTTEETLAVQCEIGEQATELLKAGMVDAARKMQCMSIFKRQTLDVMDPKFCAGIPVVGASFARFEDTQLINTVSNIPVEQTNRAASFVPQPVAPATPTGNAKVVNGQLACANGWDATIGSCARSDS